MNTRVRTEPIDRLIYTQEVNGSSPLSPTTLLEDLFSMSEWLLYKTDNPVFESGSKYDDDLETRYQWDNIVPDSASIEAGDSIAVWDGNQLLGVSCISQITTGPGKKKRNRCPNPLCNSTKVRIRKTMSPSYTCARCSNEFDDPASEIIDVTEYTAHYGPAWKNLDGLVDRDILKSMWVGSPQNQHALRRFRPGAFEKLLKDHLLESHFNLIGQAQKAIKGGFEYKVAKQRIGQGVFRRELLRKYGENCAISGPTPPKAIHACHLYSYAAVGGDHEEEGGLLIRADLHALFDAGLLNIDPKSEKVVLDTSLKQFPRYWSFNDHPLTISLTPKQKGWLKLRLENQSPSTK